MAVRRVSLVMVLLVGLAACSRSLGTPAVCGDGEFEPPETCDGDCPVSCDDGDPCTVDTMTGDALSCDVVCSHEPIVDCLDGDGCCAPGCDGENDSDCTARCGNGVTEPPETCDGDCPADCDDLDACTADLPSGGAATCDVVCTHDPVVACQDGDGCCPGGGLGACHAFNDDDCEPVCGNGMVEPPETCDDGNAVAGDGCGPTCLVEICGNGYVDVGEICDDGNTIDGDGCSANCLSDETCGNGYVDTAVGEECDDGNAVDWDGCTGCAISEFQVNTYTAHGQMYPAVAMAPDGRFVVVWNGWGSMDADGVFVQRFDSNGNPVGGDFQVNTYMYGNQNRPHVAMAGDGRFVVVWESVDQDGSIWGVYGQAYTALGVPVGSELPVNTYTLGNQAGGQVAMAEDGSFFVVWASEDQDGSGAGVYGQRYDSNANALGGELQINTYANDHQTSGIVATSADGSTLVVWESNDYAGGHGGLYGQWYDAGGSPSGGEILVDIDVPATAYSRAMAIAADGSFVIVREDGLLDGDFTGIGCQRFSSTGIPLGPYFQVNSYTNDQQGWPDVAMAPDGRYVVAWNSADQDGSGSGVYGQRYDNIGNPTGGEFQVNSYTLSDQGLPAVAMAPDGSFVVAWMSYGQDGDGSGVYAQRFDAQGNPLGRGP